MPEVLLAFLSVGVVVSVLVLLWQPVALAGVGRFLSRLLPAQPAQALQRYAEWRSVPREQAAGPLRLRRLLTKWLTEMLISVLLVSGVFVAARLLTDEVASWWPELVYWQLGSATVIWLGALLACLPIVVALTAKLKVSAITFAELRVGDRDASEHVPVVRGVVAFFAMLAGTLALADWAALLSLLLLPPFLVSATFWLVLVIFTVNAWQALVHFYARATDPSEDTAEPKPD